MQSAESLSYEAIPSRFCKSGDYAEISTSASDAFSYAIGLSSAFTMPGMYVGREHVNAIGRLGTSAQAVIQAGGLLGYTGVATYGEGAVVKVFDGCLMAAYLAAEDTSVEPPGASASTYYRVLDTSDVDDGIPDESSVWVEASQVIGADFFDVP